MKVLAITSLKGGSGRTTVATVLAVAAEKDGKSVAIFDLEPNSSACFWADLRKQQLGEAGEAPLVRYIHVSRLMHCLAAMREAGADLVILDSPRVRDVTYDVVKAADYVLIPTTPAYLDLRSTRDTIQLARIFGKPIGVVLNHCPHSGPETAQTVEIMERLSATVVPAYLHLRRTYPRAQNAGMVPEELEPKSKAAHEVRQLYAWWAKEAEDKTTVYRDPLNESSYGDER